MSATPPDGNGDRKTPVHGSGFAQPATPSGSANAISLSGLNVRAGDRVLLENLDAGFESGKVSVIVGPSGVGKSILLKIIAGLIRNRFDGIRMTGEVRIGGEPVRPGMAGVVFQNFALFDELTPEANVHFAATCGQRRPSRTAREWLQLLGVPGDVPTARLSGGQRQRLALARTLAYDPQVILYDEPTSGLDPATGRKVAGLIRETNDRFGKTSVVVTHDYPAWLPVAQHVFLFDPATRSIREIPREEWSGLAERLEQGISRNDNGTAKAPASFGSAGWWGTAWKKTSGFLEGTADALTGLLTSLASLVPLWKNPGWGLRFVRHFALLVCGPTAILYLLMAGFINGYVSTFFTFEFFPFATYTEPLLIEDLLEAIGFVLYRVFVPILTCILVAARCGAAVTADVGGRQYGDQLSAMSTFGAIPRVYLLTAIMWVFLVGTPLLTLLSWYGAQFASLVAFLWSHPERGPDFWEYFFHQRLWTPQSLWFRGAGWMLAKTAVSGLGIGAVAWHFGVQPKFSSSDVSRSVTRTILWATLFVLATHFLFAMYEFESLRQKPPELPSAVAATASR